MNGALPIPFHEIEAFCSLKGIYSLGERERLFRMIDVLDREWMRQHVEKVEKSSSSTEKDITPPPPSHSPPRNAPRQPSQRKPVA